MPGGIRGRKAPIHNRNFVANYLAKPRSLFQEGVFMKASEYKKILEDSLTRKQFEEGIKDLDLYFDYEESEVIEDYEIIDHINSILYDVHPDKEWVDDEETENLEGEKDITPEKSEPQPIAEDNTPLDEELELTPEMIDTFKNVYSSNAIVAAIVEKIEGAYRHFHWSFPADSPDSGSIAVKDGFIDCSVTETERGEAVHEINSEVELDPDMPISRILVTIDFEQTTVQVELDESLMEPGNEGNISFEEWKTRAIELEDQIASEASSSLDDMRELVDMEDVADQDWDDFVGMNIELDKSNFVVDQAGRKTVTIEAEVSMRYDLKRPYDIEPEALVIDPQSVFDELGLGKPG